MPTGKVGHKGRQPCPPCRLSSAGQVQQHPCRQARLTSLTFMARCLPQRLPTSAALHAHAMANAAICTERHVMPPLVGSPSGSPEVLDHALGALQVLVDERLCALLGSQLFPGGGGTGRNAALVTCVRSESSTHADMCMACMGLLRPCLAEIGCGTHKGATPPHPGGEGCTVQLTAAPVPCALHRLARRRKLLSALPAAGPGSPWLPDVGKRRTGEGTA